MPKIVKLVLMILVLACAAAAISDLLFGWPGIFIRVKVELTPTALVLEEFKEIEELITAEYSGEVLSSFYDTRKRHFEKTYDFLQEHKKSFLDKSNQLIQLLIQAEKATIGPGIPTDGKIIKYCLDLKTLPPGHEALFREIRLRVGGYGNDEKMRYLDLLSDSRDVVYNFYVMKKAYEKKMKQKSNEINSHEFLTLLSTAANRQKFFDNIKTTLKEVVKKKEKKIVDNTDFAYIVRGRVIASYDLQKITRDECLYDEGDGTMYIMASPQFEAIANPYFVLEEKIEIPGFIPIGKIDLKDKSYETIRCIKEYAKDLLLQDAANQNLAKTAQVATENIFNKYLSTLTDQRIKKVKLVNEKKLFEEIKLFVDYSKKTRESSKAIEEKSFFVRIADKVNAAVIAPNDDCLSRFPNLDKLKTDLLLKISPGGKATEIMIYPLLDIPVCLELVILNQLDSLTFEGPPDGSCWVQVKAEWTIKKREQ